MWKQRIKHAAAATAQGLGLWALLDRAHRGTWTIVCYHRVLPLEARARYFCPDLVVTPGALQAHCAVYREHFEVLPVRDALARMQAGVPARRPLLSLSFDDGYRDNFVHAAPVLETAGLRATFYVIAGLVGTDELPWYDRVALTCASHAEARARVEAMKRLPNAERLAQVAALGPAAPPNLDTDRIMDAAQLAMLYNSGHEVGSHSLTHPILTRVAPEGLRAEFSGARERLEAAVCGPVTTYCYPNGDFSPQVAAMVQETGHCAALSTRQGLNLPGGDPFSLKRVFIHEDWLCAPRSGTSGALLRAELALLHRFRH